MRAVLQWMENRLAGGVDYTWAFLGRLCLLTALMVVLESVGFKVLSWEALVTLAIGFTILARQQSQIEAARTLQDRRP